MIAPVTELVSETGIGERSVQIIHKERQVTARRGVYDPLQDRKDRQRKLLWFAVSTFALCEHQLAVADVLFPEPDHIRRLCPVNNSLEVARILSNVTQILEDRIVTKAKKCDHLRGSAPIWLALFNDYWLTEADTYRLALSRMALEHPFQKILLVNGDKSVDPLFEQ